MNKGDIMQIQIKEIAKTKKAIKPFINFAWKIYAEDANWVPPLKLRQQDFLLKHPFFQHSQVAYFMAFDEKNEPIGRIAAIHNTRHNETHNENIGFFGFFECIDSQQVANKLLQTAADWLKQRGLVAMRGPANFSLNDECGLLVENFDEPPVLMMTYNPSYYIRLIENFGMHKEKGLLAITLAQSDANYERMRRGAALVKKRYNAVVRSLNPHKFDEEVNRIKALYNAGWEQNWGFVKFTDAEFDYMVKELKQIYVPEMVVVLEVDGEMAGFGLALPDFNRAQIHVRDGKLFPFGIFKLWKYSRNIHFVRVIALAVMPKYRGKGLDMLLYHGLTENGLKLGYTEGEFSWTLEDNDHINAAMFKIGGKINKRYNIYQKDIK